MKHTAARDVSLTAAARLLCEIYSTFLIRSFSRDINFSRIAPQFTVHCTLLCTKEEKKLRRRGTLDSLELTQFPVLGELFPSTKFKDHYSRTKFCASKP